MSLLDNGPVLIKQLDGDRLYHTWQARYVTIDDIMQMKLCGIHLVIVDEKTGQDITRQILYRMLN